MEDPHRIRGVLAPVVTPFDDRLRPDSERFSAHCRWLISRNCGLAIFGTNSEGNSLSIEEKIELLDHLVNAGIDPGRMMPGTGVCSIPETVRLTAHAVASGCAGVLMLPPFYYKGVSEEGLFRGYSEVIQRVADERLRIYLYHIPQVSGVGIPINLIERLLREYPDAIAGIKDSGGDWAHTKRILDTFSNAGFDVFVGSESFLLANMQNGGAGCISATANVNPAAIDDLYRNWIASDAADRQTKVNEVREIVGRHGMIPSLKAVIAHFTNHPGWAKVRPPLVELDDAQADDLIESLGKLGFMMHGVRS